jgi:alpha-L-rhamnosidase
MLSERERVEWKVRLWDEKDMPGDWSESACFEMGIRQWDAFWITGDYRVDKKQRYPVDCFRKVFFVSNARSARLYITACGLYEAVLNGRRAGDFILAPGITDYKKRIQYQTYDVTDLLVTGENMLTVQLADGWYRGSTGAWGLKNQYGTETALLCQLEIIGEDGKLQTVCTDDT